MKLSQDPQERLVQLREFSARTTPKKGLSIKAWVKLYRSLTCEIEREYVIKHSPYNTEEEILEELYADIRASPFIYRAPHHWQDQQTAGVLLCSRILRDFNFFSRYQATILYCALILYCDALANQPRWHVLYNLTSSGSTPYIEFAKRKIFQAAKEHKIPSLSLSIINAFRHNVPGPGRIFCPKVWQAILNDVS